MKKEKVKQFIHLFAGFILLVHGFQAFEREDLVIAFIFVGFSIVTMVVASLQLWLEEKIRKADAFFFMLEGLVIYYSAWNYWIEKGKWMAVITAALATFYVFYSLYLFRSKKKYKRKKRRSGTVSTDPYPDRF